MDGDSEPQETPEDEQSALEAETREKWEQGRSSYYAYAAESGESPSDFEEILEGQVNLARVTY